MNQQIKQQWVEALRSGTYRQCQDHMHKRDTFCVLGVLCDIYMQARSQHWEQNHELYSYGGLYGTPPLRVQQWAGIHNRDMVAVQSRNDNGMPFHKLADWIDVNL